MKTLNEVIAEMEGMEFIGTLADALQYLKMYRSEMQMYAENQKYWEDELKQKIKDFGDAKERYIARLKELDIGTLNDPITWDELRTMEGKPVWFEGYAGNFWCIVREMQKNSDGTEDVIFDGPHGMTGVGHDDQYGTKWQTYRKERNDS